MHSTIGFVFVTLVLLLGCGRAAPRDEVRPPNVLLISIDTLRADHLGCYGYPRATSPNLDRLAADSLRFADVVAPAPWTLPSHAGLLTGVHPYRLGMVSQRSILPAAVPTLAEQLHGGSYQTAAFVDSKPHGFVGAERGFGCGFETYRHAPFRDGLVHRYDVGETVDTALEWLGHRDPRRPFFLFLHTFSVHATPNDEPCRDELCLPYDQPEPFRLRFLSGSSPLEPWIATDGRRGQQYLHWLNEELWAGRMLPRDMPPSRLEVLEAQYDAGIARVDSHLGRLLEFLGRTGLLEQTVVVVTADHGEAFLEHHLLMHHEVYRPVLRVPLIVRLPGRLGQDRGGEVVTRPVSLTAVAPTILELAGITVHGASGSASLLSSRPPADSGEVLFSYFLFPELFSYRAFGLRRGPWKLVVHNIAAPDAFSRELYDLESDPDEARPLPEDHPRRAEMEELLESLLGTTPEAPEEAFSRDLPRLRESLAALGYIE